MKMCGSIVMNLNLNVCLMKKNRLFPSVRGHLFGTCWHEICSDRGLSRIRGLARILTGMLSPTRLR